MENSIREKQFFRQWWLLVILILIMGTLVVGLYVQLVLDIPFGNNPMSNSGFIVLMFLLVSFFGAFFALRLESGADDRGVYFRFYPFQRKYVLLQWENIERIELLEYNPLTEYGGWGWRLSLSGKGTAYNVSGNKGIRFELKSGKKRLLGIQKTVEWNIVLEHYSGIHSIAYDNRLNS
jgi:hypothetical protein